MKNYGNYIIMLLLLLLLLSSAGCAPTGGIIYDPNFDENAQYIEAAHSPNFTYACTIEVNDLPPENNSISLTYQVRIDLKDTGMHYKNVEATCMLNDAVRDILTVPRKYFGNNMRDRITLDKENRGLILALTTWIDRSAGISHDELQRRLKEPIKTKVKWAQSEEYVLIGPEAIEVTVHGSMEDN